MGKHKKPMPSYYGKNVAQHAQRRVLKRQRERREREALVAAAQNEEAKRELAAKGGDAS